MSTKTYLGSAIKVGERAEWVRLYKAGSFLIEIAREYRVSPETVRNELMRRGVEMRPPGGGYRVQPEVSAPAPVAKPAQPRIWCTQCDRNVEQREAEQCGSKWCKAKECAA